MKKFAKILVILLSVALIIGALALVIGAEGGVDNTAKYVDKDGVEYTGTFDEMYAMAVDGEGTLYLTGNWTPTAETRIAKSVTIDLNGYSIISSYHGNLIRAWADNMTLNIVGEGTITHSRAILSTNDKSNVTFNMVGSGYGIHINHSTNSNYNATLFYVNNGCNFSLKNVAITTTACPFVAQDYDNSLIRVQNASSATFENVVFKGMGQPQIDFNGNVPSLANYVFRIDATSFVHLKSSYIRAASNGIQLEAMQMGKEVLTPNASDADDATDTYSFIAEDTTIILDRYTELDGETIPSYKATSFRFMDIDKTSAEAEGKVYIKDSHVAMTSSFAVYGTATDTQPNLVTVDKSTVKTLRHTYDNGTKITDERSDSWPVQGSVYINFINGSRVDTAYYKTTLARTSSMDSKVDTETNPDQGTYTIDFAEGTRANVKNIGSVDLPAGLTWVLDPVGNGEYPYVVANAATYTHSNVTVNHLSVEEYDSQTVGKAPSSPAVPVYGNGGGFLLDTVQKVYGVHARTLQIPYKTDGVIDSKFSGVSKAGNIVFAGTGEIGDNVTSWTANYPNNRYNVPDANRTDKVYVCEFDVASENGIFPGLQVQARYTAVSNSIEFIQLNPDGSFYNNSNATLSTTGWNNVKIVADFNTMKGYCYVNGTLLSEKNLRAGTTGFQYYEFRLLAPSSTVVHKAGASISIKDTEIYSYTNAINGYSALDYVVAGPYDGETGDITVNGRPYKTLDAAIAAANAKDTFVVLNGATDAQTISTDAVIVDNTGANAFTAGEGYQLTTLSDTPNTGAKVYKVAEESMANVYWYFGTAATPEGATSTRVEVGSIPQAPAGTPSGANTYKDDAKILFAGWSDKYVALDSYNRFSDYEAALVAAGVEIIDSFAAVESDADLYFYPVYAKNEDVDLVIKHGDGSITDVEDTGTRTGHKNAFTNLADGDTLVFFNNFTLNYWLDNRAASNQIKTFTDMHVGIDLNGFTYHICQTRYYGSLNVGENSVLDVYSSVPGGRIVSYYGTATSVTSANAFTITGDNAVLNLGKFGDIPGENLEIHGNVVGVDSTTKTPFANSQVNIDGGLYNRLVANGHGIMSAPGSYMGTFNVSNATIISSDVYNPNSLVAISGEYTDGAPGMVFDNCTMISDNADSYINYIELGGKMVFNNCTIGGLLDDGADIDGVGCGDVTAGLGTVATAMSAGVKTPDGYVKANIDSYAIPMFRFFNGTEWSSAETTVYDIMARPEFYDFGTDNDLINFVLNGKATIYSQEAGYEGDTGKVGSNVTYVLPSVNVGVVSETDTFTANWLDLEGNVAATKVYQKGSTAYTEYDPFIYGKTLTTLVIGQPEEGDQWTYDTSDASVVVAKPIIVATVRNLGAKMNLTLYSTLDMNFHIPAKHFANVVNKEIFAKDINNPEEYAITSNGGVNYYAITTPVDSNEVSGVKEVTITFSEEFNGVTYTASAKLSSSIKAYAEKVLADRTAETPKHTEADYRLIYFMAQYLNAANDYYASVDREDDSTRFNLAGYEDLATGYTYTLPTEGVELGTLSGSGIGMVVDLTSSPTWKITLPAGMTGKAVIDNKTYDLAEGENFISLSILDFDAEIKMTVETADGTIAGSFSLANYILMTKDTSPELYNLYNAFYAYIQYAKEFDAIGK